MKRRTTPLEKVIAVLAAVAFLIGTAYITGEWPFKPFDSPFASEPDGDKNSRDVTANGGSFQFDSGIRVSVPAGAVDKDATLSVSGIRQLAKKAAGPLGGLRDGAETFDVSLSSDRQSHMQPKKPLRVMVPLPLSMGAHTTALPYTTDGRGNYYLLPYTVNGNTLVIDMPRLSPKYIAYVSDDKLLADFDADQTKVNPGSCSQQVTVNDTKVKFGSKSKGWSTQGDSPIFACLAKGSDGYVRVNMVNRIDYILAVASANNVRLAASKGDVDTEMVKSITRLIFPDNKVKAYAGLDDKIVGSIAVGDLPATIELRGDPPTFFAGNIWTLLNLSIELLSGKTGSETIELANVVLNAGDYIACTQKLADDLGDNPSAKDVILGGMACTGVVIDVLAQHFGVQDIWKRAALLIDAVNAIVDTAVKAGNGIRLQLNNTMRVAVESSGESRDFFGLRLTMSESWNVDIGSSNFVRISDKNRCDSDGTCSEFYVDKTNYLGSVLYPECGTDDYYPTPATMLMNINTSVGGRPAKYTEMQLCDSDGVVGTLRAWRVSGLVLHSMAYGDSGGQMTNLDSVLANATWN